MMRAANNETFPLMSSTSANAQPLTSKMSRIVRKRRKSSGLGGEIRAGDTGAPALATLDGRLPSPLLSQGPSKAVPGEKERKRPFTKRRKAKSLLQHCRRYAVKNTWLVPLVLIVAVLAAYAVNPSESNVVHWFIFLSYKIPRAPDAPPDAPYHYAKGRWDIAFVGFYIIVLSFTREFAMQNMLRPLARRSGLKSRAKQSRFMEQMYTAMYFGVLGPCGLYVMSGTPVWYFHTRGMYESFPHKTHEAAFKFYYLFQASYWAQQAIVLMLGMEKPRKDFKELVGHHIVTLALITLSYRFHFTYIGLAVYITHDISDFFLATSKVLNYLDHPLVGPYFGFFICVWLYLRHYLNLKIIYSLFSEYKTVGPYVLDWEAEQYKCPLANFLTVTLLASLQLLNIFWLYYIFRIAYRFVFLNIAEDDRSDNDENEFKEEQRLEALRQQSVDALARPQVLLNGDPIGPIGAEDAGGKTSATHDAVKDDEVTKRKASLRKKP